MKLQKHERLALEAIECEIGSLSGASISLVRSRHLGAVIETANGDRHKIVIPSSPKTDCVCCVNKARQQAAKLVRRVNAENDNAKTT